ncbi:MAG: ribonuclease P protein component [Bellilinea sp.]
MKRAFRLRQATDFSRVRRNGKSFPHPLVVLVALPNADGMLRIGVSAGKVVGTAVVRNRAKRQLRASIDQLLASLASGWDLIFLARGPIRDADFDQISIGVRSVLQRAGLLQRESAELNDRARLLH